MAEMLKYYEKMPIKVTYPNQRDRNSGAKRDLRRLQRLPDPPSRPQLIPICTYQSNGDAGGDKHQSEQKPETPQRLSGPQRTVKKEEANATQAESPRKAGASSSSPLKPEGATPSTAGLAEEKTTEIKKKVYSFVSSSGGFIKPALQDNSRLCKSWTTKEGVLVTKITGWDDSENPFEPITMTSRKITSDTESRAPYTALELDQMYLVRLAHVVDPLQFYLEFVTSPLKDSDSWDESLQAFYNQKGVAEKYSMRTLRPYRGQWYVVYNEKEGKWERIKVKRVQLDKQTVLGMYLDRLQPASDMPISSLFELHPNFGNWPRYSVSASLTQVRPCGYVPGVDDEKTHLDWPQNAIDFFKNYTKGKLFRAFIVSKKLKRWDNIAHASDTGGFAHVSVHLSTYLFEVGAECQIPVNAWLVQKGFAVPIKSMEGCVDMMETLHGLKLDTETPPKESDDAKDCSE